MAAASVLTRERDFEDLLGTGKSFTPPDRKYIRLTDDLSFPRTTYSLEELKAYALRVQQRRRFWEDLGHAAAATSVPVSSYAYAQGAHREDPDTTELVSPLHDDAALSEGVRREAEQQQRNDAHADRMQSTGTLWDEGHDQPTTVEEIMRKHNIVEPTSRPGPAEGALRSVGEAGGALIGGGGTRSGIGHDLGKATGRVVGSTAGKVVDTAGAVFGKLGEAAGVVGGGLLDAFSPLEPDIPSYIPRKIQQHPRPKPRPAHRKRGDL